MGSLIKFRKSIKKLSLQLYGMSPHKIKYLGGGGYGNVFEIYAEKPLVIKFISIKGVCKKEVDALALLRSHTDTAMPEVYRVFGSDEDMPEGYIMSKIEGIPLGSVYPDKINSQQKEKLFGQIFNALNSWHSLTGEVFGELGSEIFSTFRDYFRQIADRSIKELPEFVANGRFAAENYLKLLKIYEDIDNIVSEDIKPSLLHGDLKPWNIMIDVDFNLTGIIDPCNTAWGDKVLDLRQLNKNNGQKLGLLDAYKKSFPVLPDFDKKICMYTVFFDLWHCLEGNYMRNDVVPHDIKRYFEI